MDLFNVSYEILLLLLQRFFAHTEETDAQLKVLADAGVALMVSVVRPLGDLATTLPAGPEYPGRNGAPSRPPRRGPLQPQRRRPVPRRPIAARATETPAPPENLDSLLSQAKIFT
jgi:hypothetical protein